jgi:tyrosine aminotransferase
VAAYHSARLPPGCRPLGAGDVLMAHGASQALSLALGAIANPGANVLLPRPGFPLYQTLCEYYGLEYRHYDLRPGAGWEADLAHIASLADAKTGAIVVCNPSNPCGSAFSAAHLRELLAAAAAAGAVVIADEVYADIVWADGASFTPMVRARAPSSILRFACPFCMHIRVR